MGYFFKAAVIIGDSGFEEYDPLWEIPFKQFPLKEILNL
jgi:hypothetical protein